MFTAFLTSLPVRLGKTSLTGLEIKINTTKAKGQEIIKRHNAFDRTD